MSSSSESCSGPQLSSRDLKKKQAKLKLCNKSTTKKVTKILSENLKNGKKLTTIERTILESRPELVQEIKKKFTRRQADLAKKRDKASEIIDEEQLLEKYAKELAKLLWTCKESGKSVICYTGAGLSTAANIRDYRGPNGVWTEINKTGYTNLPNQSVHQSINDDKLGPLNLKINDSLTQAKPTKAHLILKRLMEKNYLDHILSQNCDGLHIRSGIPKEKLSEIHGNMYVERCSNEKCKSGPIYRIFDVTEKTGFRRHATGRFCRSCSPSTSTIEASSRSAKSSTSPRTRAAQETPVSPCGAELLDTIVHFGEYAPSKNVIYPYNWLAAYKKIYPWWDGKDSSWKSKVITQNSKIFQQASKSKQKLGLILCLGTSLAVLKSYKQLWPKDFKNMVIVNLQYTPKDSSARMKVHARCDDFLELVYEQLHVIESSDWEIPNLSDEERKNYYTPTDIPDYNLKSDQLLTLAKPVHQNDFKSINTLSIFKPKFQREATKNLPSEPEEKKTKIEKAKFELKIQAENINEAKVENLEIFNQLPLPDSPEQCDHNLNESSNINTSIKSSTKCTVSTTSTTITSILSPAGSKSAATTDSRSSTPCSGVSCVSSSASSEAALPFEDIPEQFSSLVAYIDQLEKPRAQPGWYGVGNKRKRPK